MRTRLVMALAVGLCCSPSSSAQAQGSSKQAGLHTGSVPARSLAALDKGIVALDAHDLPAATRLLTDAYRQSQRSEVLYQLGRLAVAEARTLDAYDLMRRYLADPSRLADAAATQAAEALVAQPPPPSGSLALLSDAGALVFVDGHAVATLPLLLPLLVAPGAHTVKLEFSGKILEAPVQAERSRLTEVRMSRASGAVLVSVLPAILWFSAGAGLPGDAASLLNEALEQAARDEQYTLLAADQLLAKGEELERCRVSEACQRELARQHKVELVLQQVAKQVAPRSALRFELRLLRLGLAEPAAQAAMTCTDCLPTAAAARLKEAAVKVLTDGLSRSQGTLRLTAEPPGVTLRLGERTVGPAPLTEHLWAGSYEVIASHPGYQSAHHAVEIGEGTPAELHLILQRTGTATLVPEAILAQPKDRTGRPRWRLALGGAMLGVGAAMTIGGAAGVALDNSCAAEPLSPGEPCPRLYDTRVGGGITLGSGLLFLGAGGLLLALPGPRQ